MAVTPGCYSIDDKDVLRALVKQRRDTKSQRQAGIVPLPFDCIYSLA